MSVRVPSLGPLLGRLEDLWGNFVALLGCPEDVLGAFWAALGRSWGLLSLGRLGALPARNGKHTRELSCVGLSEPSSGASWSPLWSSWGPRVPSGGRLGRLRAIFGRFEALLDCLRGP
eukprot:1926460-Pyramimonas_sp.AAC.1